MIAWINMACKKCGKSLHDSIRDARAKFSPKKPGELVMVRLERFSDKYALVHGKSGRGYGMRKNGSVFYVFKEDAHAEPDKFTLVVDPAVLGNGQARQVPSPRQRTRVHIRNRQVPPRPEA